MKQTKFFLFLLFIFPGFLFSAGMGYKAIAVRGDTSFEWQNNVNTPEKVSGNGTVLSVDVSINKKYIAVLTTAGIEIFDYKTLRFIKTLLLQKNVKNIRFTPQDDFLVFNTQSEITRWGIFNFSFKKLEKFPSLQGEPVTFKVSGFRLLIQDGGVKKVITRGAESFYRFAFKNGQYAATATEHGVLYDFTNDNLTIISDKVYNISGELIDISPDSRFGIFKIGQQKFIKQLINGKTLLKLPSASFVYFAKHIPGHIVKAYDRILTLENFRGAVLLKKEFNSSIKFVSVNQYGIAIIADKTSIIGYDFKDRFIEATDNEKAFPLKNGALILTKKIRGMHTILEINNQIKTVRGHTTTGSVYFDGTTMSFSVPGGMNWKKPGEMLWKNVPGAKKIFQLGGIIFAVKQKILNALIDGIYKTCHISLPEFTVTNGQTVFFVKNAKLHSLDMNKPVVSLLTSINADQLLKKAEELSGNPFARSIEYSHLLRLFKDNGKALLSAAGFFYENENFENAYKIYRQLIRKGEKKAEIAKGAGISAFKLKKYAEAVSYLLRAAALLKNDAATHYYLGTTYYRLNNNPAAIRHLNLSIHYDPANMNAYQNLGLLYKKINNYPMAENTYFKGLAINENSDDLYFNLGRLYELQNKLPLALLCLKKAFSLKERDTIYSYQIAQIYIKLKQWDKALEFLKTTLSINPEYAPAQYNLGWIYERHKNNPVLARYHYRFFMELEPNSRYKRQIQRFLSSQ